MSNLGGKTVSEDTDKDNQGLDSVVAGTNIDNIDDTDPRNPIINAAAGSGETNTASNVGGETGEIFKQKTGADLELKTIKQGSRVTITNNASDVEVAADLQLKNTTKGDLEGFSTVAARIPVGTDDDVLTADSSAALGVSWQTPAAGGGGNSGCRLTKTSEVLDNTFAALTWDVEVYDDDGFADLGTDDTKLTIPTGVTRVNIQAYVRPQASTYDDGDYLNTYIRHFNSSDVLQSNTVVAVSIKDAAGGVFGNVTGLGIDCVATDYFQIWLIPEDVSWTLTEATVTIQDVSP